MNQRMQYFDLLRPDEAKNDWDETVKTWKRVRTIRAAVSVGSGGAKERSELLRVESTHTGLTLDVVRTGDRLKPVRGGEAYRVDYVIEGGRYRQLMLTREEAVGENAT